MNVCLGALVHGFIVGWFHCWIVGLFYCWMVSLFTMLMHSRQL